MYRKLKGFDLTCGAVGSRCRPFVPRQQFGIIRNMKALNATGLPGAVGHALRLAIFRLLAEVPAMIGLVTRAIA